MDLENDSPVNRSRDNERLNLDNEMVDVDKYYKFDSVTVNYDVMMMDYLSDEYNKDGNDPLYSSQWSFLMNRRQKLSENDLYHMTNKSRKR